MTDIIMTDLDTIHPETLSYLADEEDAMTADERLRQAFDAGFNYEPLPDEEWLHDIYTKPFQAALREAYERGQQESYEFATSHNTQAA